MVDEYVVGTITEEQKMIAKPLLDAFPDNTFLMKGMYKDQEVAFVCEYGPEDDEDVLRITPRFIVVTEDMFDDCKDPVGATPEVLDAGS